MDDPARANGETLERFRSYLCLLVRAHLAPQFHHKLDASDLVQQTLLDAHEKRDHFRGNTDGQRAAWLRQILANNLADALRHHGRAKRDAHRERSLDDLVDDSFHRTMSWMVARVPSPSQRAIGEEELLRLSEAVAALPAAQQQAVILHYLQELKLAEVAREMGRSEASVAGLLHRGIKRLNQILDVSDRQ